MLKRNLKVLLLTHTDLDGIGCDIIVKLAYGVSNVETHYCDYTNINEKALEGLRRHDNYDLIIISDISVSLEVAEQLNFIKDKVIILDHHDTALPLNKFDFGAVSLTLNNHETCGTELVFNYLMELLEQHQLYRWDRLESLYNFVESVRRYDTWEWKTKYLYDPTPVKLDNLLKILDIEDFVSSMFEKFEQRQDFITKTDELLLDVEEKRKNRFFEKKHQTLKTKHFWGYNVGIIFTDDYVSELANYVFEKEPTIDIMILIVDGKVSYRTSKKGIDVSKIAQLYGGGGRTQTSGSEISVDVINRFFNDIFKHEDLHPELKWQESYFKNKKDDCD